jgi:CheY-like chemotaxis protein
LHDPDGKPQSGATELATTRKNRPRTKRLLGKDEPLILVVDDARDNRELYVEFLMFSGYRVVEGADGLEAVSKAQSLHPDLVVMDIGLPNMSGWEATQILRRDPSTSSIPIIILTGFAHGLGGDPKAALPPREASRRNRTPTTSTEAYSARPTRNEPFLKLDQGYHEARAQDVGKTPDSGR